MVHIIANVINVERNRNWMNKCYTEDHKDEKKAYDKKNDTENLDRMIYNKINNNKRKDLKYKRPFHDDAGYINIKWVKDRLKQCDYKCENCHCQLELTKHKAYSLKQFSINRYFNKYAHMTCNCWISCWDCNNKRYMNF